MNRSKTNDIRAYNMAVIEETLEIGGNLNAAKRKLAVGRDKMHTLRDEQGNVMHNIDKIIKIAERYYTRLCNSDVGPEQNMCLQA